MYREHRNRFLETLGQSDSAAVVFSGSAAIRNNDCEYRFRPHSDFWYLTGFAEPDSVLVLLPKAEGSKTVLFLRKRIKKEEIWNGVRLGVERAPAELGVDEAYPIEELWDRLSELLEGHDRVMYRTGEDEARDRQVLSTISDLRARVRTGARAPLEIIDPSEILHEQRLVKNAAEVDVVRRAVEITTEAHAAAMREVEPGKSEAEIDALIEYTFKRRGSTGPAYTNIVAGGEGACVLHYIENDRELKDGDLLLIDAGAEWSFYASDVTRTFPVNGTFSPEQRALYEVVLEAQVAAIEAVKPGNTFLAAHQVAVERLVTGLIGLGLLEGPAEKAIEEKTYDRFYMHKTGHWLGLDVHDCGRYHLDGDSRKLEPGMITTVEPGLYVAADDETVEERWRGIGIRIEDDVLVTEAGNEVLTSAIPKGIDEVEAACRGASLEHVG